MDRQSVYAVIDSERDYQHKVWNDANRKGAANNPSSFILFMEEYLCKARAVACRVDEGNSEDVAKIMDIIRKVVALGVAAAEFNGMPKRLE